MRKQMNIMRMILGVMKRRIRKKNKIKQRKSKKKNSNYYQTHLAFVQNNPLEV